MLDLCGCYLLTDRAVIALAAWCPNLRALGLHCCRQLTDLSMRALAASGARLRAGRPGGCVLLRAPAVQAVCDAFPALHTCAGRRSLNVSGCLALLPVSCRCATLPLRGRPASP
eukprot:SM000164S02258  [mRNA]  locus=s164:187552:188910:- [translate_table: standard]